MQATGPLGARALEHMVIGVSTRKYDRSLQPAAPVLEAHATSKSAVNRRFTAKTRAQLETALSVPLASTTWAVLLIDGIAFADHVVIILMGIDATGRKHILGMREGSSENATGCRKPLADLIARVLAADRRLLIVMDGGKGLREAVAQVFGAYAVVQRCQVHKRRNVMEHLHDDKRAQLRSVMEQAYRPPTSAANAKRLLDNLARSLDENHPRAAASLRVMRKLPLFGRTRAYLSDHSSERLIRTLKEQLLWTCTFDTMGGLLPDLLAWRGCTMKSGSCGVTSTSSQAGDLAGWHGGVINANRCPINRGRCTAMFCYSRSSKAHPSSTAK